MKTVKIDPTVLTASQLIAELQKFPADARVTIAVKKYRGRSETYDAKLAPALAVQKSPFIEGEIIIVGTQ